MLTTARTCGVISEIMTPEGSISNRSKTGLSYVFNKTKEHKEMPQAIIVSSYINQSTLYSSEMQL